ncbi:MAG: glycoside hydrolase family 101 beta sandwich domain-containing protein [Planctomycetaceae bacterium]
MNSASICVAIAIVFAAGPMFAQTANPPAWAAKGAYVFRVSTPDDANMLPQLEEGHAIVANLLDNSVPQITIVNGLIGHDHRGPWNWDGLWPYWNRVTFRAGSFQSLADFMQRTRQNSNTLTGFHLNLTDVNLGLRDYPESRDFFESLVATRSIYRRDWNPTTNRREGNPYVPQSLSKGDNPVEIDALMNYKQFWESGLAKKMIDEFYGKLPYAPPLLYLDVLNAQGGNFSTGLPDGPLSGSEQSQIEGMQAIADYLHGKGTDIGTEGERSFLGNDVKGVPRAGYVWLHGQGFSSDDYHIISGGAGTRLASQHVYGNPGAFNVSPIASTKPGLQKVREHYAALLKGMVSHKTVADQTTCHIAYREGGKPDEFDIPGTGDPFRGDWADLVNNFYLTTIQELYHIGNRSVRTRSDSIGAIHLGSYSLSGEGETITVSVPDFAEPEWLRKSAQQNGRLMIERPITTEAMVSKAGKYRLKVTCFLGGRCDDPRLGIYLNGKHLKNFDHLPISEGKSYELDVGEVDLQQGQNLIGFDSGLIRAAWSDGTVAEWTTPSLATGFKAWKGDVLFADGYDRMWPDSWSGQKKIYFFSWEGAQKSWKLPKDWISSGQVTLYPLTPEGRGPGQTLAVKDQAISPNLLPQLPYVLVP